MRHWFTEHNSEQLCLLAEPYLDDVWREGGGPARQAIIDLQTTLSRYQPCLKLTSMAVDYDDIWLRDSLPLWFTEQAGTAPIWQGWLPRFDGWGGIQSSIAKDQRLAGQLFSLPISTTDWIAEAGAFNHNGEWLLVGLACLKQRNPNCSEAWLQQQVNQSLAPLKPLFIDVSLSADETGGHIDNMALFVDQNTLIYSYTDDPQHPDFAACQQLKQQLSSLPAQIRQIALPLPEPQWASADERNTLVERSGSLSRSCSVPLLCSYVNAIVLPEAVIMPSYGLETDEAAIRRVQDALPNKSVEAFPAREFVLGGGGLHCISHQVPKALAPLLNVHGLDV